MVREKIRSGVSPFDDNAEMEFGLKTAVLRAFDKRWPEAKLSFMRSSIARHFLTPGTLLAGY
jgi:hypothetical protein|tara:strand:- start:17878 stop:18063 length:186 start_codon:yes stop_codon:yes gene_type:complete